MAERIIKQISIFAENKPGRLATIAEALEKKKVNILAFSIAEAEGFGVIRAIVDDAKKAYKTLTDMGLVVSFTDVIAVKMRDEPGGLKDIAKVLGEAGINIDYAYAYSGRDAAVLILRVDKPAEAVEKLAAKGSVLLGQKHFE